MSGLPGRGPRPAACGWVRVLEGSLVGWLAGGPVDSVFLWHGSWTGGSLEPWRMGRVQPSRPLLTNGRPEGGEVWKLDRGFLRPETPPARAVACVPLLWASPLLRLFTWAQVSAAFSGIACPFFSTSGHIY